LASSSNPSLGLRILSCCVVILTLLPDLALFKHNLGKVSG
jgi:hypothetical protein